MKKTPNLDLISENSEVMVYPDGKFRIYIEGGDVIFRQSQHGVKNNMADYVDENHKSLPPYGSARWKNGDFSEPFTPDIVKAWLKSSFNQ